MYDSNSDLGYKCCFCCFFAMLIILIDVFCTMKHARSKITVNELAHDQLGIINILKTLLDFRSGYNNIDGCDIYDVNQ